MIVYLIICFLPSGILCDGAIKFYDTEGSGANYVPGFGAYFEPFTISPSVRNPRSPTPADLKAVASDDVVNPMAVGVGDMIDKVTFPDDKDDKCSFVQMKGAPLPNMQCQKGGMACDKQCGFDDAKVEMEKMCEIVMENQCEDVPKEICRNATRKVCTNTAEEICEPEFRTKT